MRMNLVALALIASCGGDDDVAVRQSPCEQLREHLVDLQLATGSNIDREAHRANLRQSLGRDFLATCATLSDAEVACALDAPDTSSATACATRAP